MWWHDLPSNVHTWFTRTIVLPVSEKQWIVRPSRRESLLARRHGLRFRTAAQSWSDSERQSYVLNRLRAILRHAKCHVPFYQRLFSACGFDPGEDFTFRDFARLPVVEREDVIANEEEMTSRDIRLSRLTLDSTGGSTGKPVRVWLGPIEIGWRDSGSLYYQRRIGIVPGGRTALLWGHHLDPVIRDGLQQRIRAFAQNCRWLDCFRLSPAVLEKYHAEMQSWKPDYLIAYAGALASLAEHVLQHGYRPEYPRVCCLTGAEKLFPRQRQLVEAAFGRVHERYGGRDVGLVAFQVDCRDGTLEVDWANQLIEPATSEADSSVLVTKLHADGMPMIRYRLGDVARFPSGSQPGHPAFAIREVLGRVTDRIMMPTGEWISGLQFPHMMKNYPVREFMLVQHSDYSIELQVVPSQGFAESDQRTIHATVAANLPGIPLRISVVEQVARSRAGKLKPVVSEIVTAGEERCTYWKT